jgi:rRNA maturation RNase YbeY
MHVVRTNHSFLRFSTKETFRAIDSVLRAEKRKGMSISVVFTHHRFIRKLNREFLGHDYSTDVIAFATDADTGVDGELYVNLDRARSQARQYRVSFWNEIKRLLIHGTLHVLGYSDKTTKQRNSMLARENRYVSLLEER